MQVKDRGKAPFGPFPGGKWMAVGGCGWQGVG